MKPMLWKISLVPGRDLPAKSTDTTRSCATKAAASPQSKGRLSWRPLSSATGRAGQLTAAPTLFHIHDWQGLPWRSSTTYGSICLEPQMALWCAMGTKSRETIYGASVRASAERAAEACKAADRLACEAWNKRMLGFQGPAHPLRRWVTLSTPATPISKSNASAAAPIRPLPWTSCAGRRPRQSTSLSATCDARIAHRSAGVPTSAATW